MTKTTQYSIGEVVLSALPARLPTDDTQAYIRMDCKRGNPVSSLGVGGNGLWTKNNFSPHLEVAFRPCVSGNWHKKIYKKYHFFIIPRLYTHTSIQTGTVNVKREISILRNNTTTKTRFDE